ncbi:MAG: desulfoferrodoxin [Thermoprotei archaeon]|nr:MAG: desulfoferrodoxin [Thermoprotei archaeon]
MAELRRICKCNVCGNIVVVLHAGVDKLVCCGQPMQLIEERGEGVEGWEKHVPVVGRVGDEVKVKVGSVAHPMEEGHFIEWVELETNGQACKVFLKPGMDPEASFRVGGGKMIVKAYCDLHGLWVKESG